MISETSRYYGCVLYQIIGESDVQVSLRRLDDNMPGFYLVNNKLPFYIKYSTSRTGPWSFNFQTSHREFQKELTTTYGDCITAFVCGRDGIAALRYLELKNVLNGGIDPQETVSIRRRHNRMYQIKGRNGTLDRKIARSSLAEILKD